jgi:hypothetical protein
MKVARSSSLRPGRLYPQEISVVLIFVTGWLYHRTIVRPEKFNQLRPEEYYRQEILSFGSHFVKCWENLQILWNGNSQQPLRTNLSLPATPCWHCHGTQQKFLSLWTSSVQFSYRWCRKVHTGHIQHRLYCLQVTTPTSRDFRCTRRAYILLRPASDYIFKYGEGITHEVRMWLQSLSQTDRVALNSTKSSPMDIQM